MEMVQKNKDIPHPTMAVASKPNSLAVSSSIVISQRFNSKSVDAPLKKLVCRSTNHGLCEDDESEPENKRRSSTITVKASNLPFLEESPVVDCISITQIIAGALFLCSRKLNQQQQKIWIAVNCFQIGTEIHTGTLAAKEIKPRCLLQQMTNLILYSLRR